LSRSESDVSARGGVARRIRCQHQSRQETGQAYHPQVKERVHLGQLGPFREAVAAADGGLLQASSGACPSRALPARSLLRDKLREVPLWLGSRPISADISEADVAAQRHAMCVPCTPTVRTASADDKRTRQAHKASARRPLRPSRTQRSDIVCKCAHVRCEPHDSTSRKCAPSLTAVQSSGRRHTRDQPARDPV
jgi:hypothetical protein